MKVSKQVYRTPSPWFQQTTFRNGGNWAEIREANNGLLCDWEWRMQYEAYFSVHSKENTVSKSHIGHQDPEGGRPLTSQMLPFSGACSSKEENNATQELSQNKGSGDCPRSESLLNKTLMNLCRIWRCCYKVKLKEGLLIGAVSRLSWDKNPSLFTATYHI